MKRILTHRGYLLNPITEQPTRKEFGLPERTVIPADQLAAAQSAIEKRLDTQCWHELDDLPTPTRQAIKDEFVRVLTEITMWDEDEREEKAWKAAANSLGYSTNFIELLDLERRYNSRLREFKQYQHWKKTRNPARAGLEEKFGFDCKHAMHLCRLSEMCKEILREGVVRIKRPDAQKLLEIRNGAWSFEELVAWFGEQKLEIEALYKTTSLPDEPNRNAIDDLCTSLVEEFHYGQR
jgi:hypothetical protein